MRRLAPLRTRPCPSPRVDTLATLTPRPLRSQVVARRSRRGERWAQVRSPFAALRVRVACVSRSVSEPWLPLLCVSGGAQQMGMMYPPQQQGMQPVRRRPALGVGAQRQRSPRMPRQRTAGLSKIRAVCCADGGDGARPCEHDAGTAAELSAADAAATTTSADDAGHGDGHADDRVWGHATWYAAGPCDARLLCGHAEPVWPGRTDVHHA